MEKLRKLRRGNPRGKRKKESRNQRMGRMGTKSEDAVLLALKMKEMVSQDLQVPS